MFANGKWFVEGYENGVPSPAASKLAAAANAAAGRSPNAHTVELEWYLRSLRGE